MSWLEEKEKFENKTLQRGTFFPAIESEKFFELYRPPSELPFNLVIEQLKIALYVVVRELDFWRSNQSATSLVELDEDLVLIFERAVFCEAKAELLKETLTTDRRSAAENSAKTSEETEEKYRELSADAIRLICGESRIFVGSI